MQDKYIFLDIDGVLVKEDRPEEEIVLDADDLQTLKFDPQCANRFETIVRKYKNVKIVISSSWREIFTLNTIKSKFSDDIAARVVGATPTKSYDVDKYYRYQEVLDYLRQHGLEENPWVAIDDIAEHFPPSAPVIVTDPFEGFDEITALELEYFCLTTGKF